MVSYKLIIILGWCPNNNFMNEEELLESLYFKTYSQDRHKFLQSLPIILPVKNEDKERIEKAKTVNLVSSITNKVVASIEEPTLYKFRKEELCNKIFGINSQNHPKVAKIYSSGDWLLTGKQLTFHSNITYEDGMDDLRLTSSTIRKIIKEKNVDVVYAFQLRNPLHNGHCMLLEDARAKLIRDGYKNPLLLLHPCGGWTKDDDVPLKTRIDQHRALIDNNVLNKDSTLLAIWPSPMYYAGPLEVLWHFSSREFAGVNYMIVGRDPAGVKHPEINGADLYDPFHGQKVKNNF
jgi:3'-phosphoadenosine 5'-phosphosulfate synthase